MEVDLFMYLKLQDCCTVIEVICSPSVEYVLLVNMRVLQIRVHVIGPGFKFL